MEGLDKRDDGVLFFAGERGHTDTALNITIEWFGIETSES